jgi:hypothetical protein
MNNFSNIFFSQFQVELPILSNAECTNLILAGGFENEIKPFEVCAGFASGQKDTCGVNNIKKCLRSNRAYSFNPCLCFP